MEALIRDSLMHFSKAFPADLKYCFFSLTGVYNIAQLTELFTMCYLRRFRSALRPRRPPARAGLLRAYR